MRAYIFITSVSTLLFGEVYFYQHGLGEGVIRGMKGILIILSSSPLFLAHSNLNEGYNRGCHTRGQGMREYWVAVGDK